MIAEVCPEIEVAAKWWADKLRNPVMDHDFGLKHIQVDHETSMLVDVFGATRPVIPADAIDRFEARLVQLQRIEFVDKSAWQEADEEGNPMIGQGLRVLATDWGPDYMLTQALESAGIRRADVALPMKTAMWVSPGRVSVRVGMSGEQIDIYGGNSTVEGDAKDG